MSLKELEGLGESNYQLLSIGRNLNQVAKALHERQRPLNVLELIEKLIDVIDEHTKRVSRATRASLERWDIK